MTERPGEISSTSRQRGIRSRAYLLLLWLVAAALVLGMFGCASGSSDGSAEKGRTGLAATGDSSAPLRLLLVGTSSQDSIRVIGDFHVDQVLRQIFDSVPGVEYVTLNHRDSTIRAKDPTGSKGIRREELFGALDLDGGIDVALARFGSVLALELRILDGPSGKPRFRDLIFQTIRFRDSAGTMLVGPALYDALRTGVSRFIGREHAKGSVVASTPLVLSGIVIPTDPRLREISKAREGTARSVLTALYDYAGLHFPELVVFDAGSRDMLYRTVRIGSVASHMAPKAAEIHAMFNVGIDRHLVGSIDPVGTDSLRMRLEIRSVLSPTRDSVELAREMIEPVNLFSSTAFEEDVIVAMLDLAEPLFREAADSVKARYERARVERVAGASRTGGSK